MKNSQRRAMFARLKGYTIYASKKGSNEPFARVSPYVFDKKSHFGSLQSLKNSAPNYNLKILRWKHDAVITGEPDRIPVKFLSRKISAQKVSPIHRKKIKLTPSVEKNYDGSLTVSDIIKGQGVHRQYMGYTKREAVRRFKEEFQ